jgi:hypothetical protein
MPYTFLIQSHIERTESHIIKDGRAEELILRALEDETHLSSNLLQIFFIDRNTQDDHLSLSHQGSIQMIEEGGLAGSIWAKDRYGLMFIDLQMDVPEGRGPVWIIIREMVNFNNFIGYHAK